PPMPRRLIPFCLAVAGLLGGCDTSVKTEFRAETGASTASGPLLRNEPLTVEFSSPLDDATPPAEAVRVVDGAGRRIPVRLAARGAVLEVFPSATEGWPAGADLRLDIPYPSLGRPLTAADGTALRSGYRSTVRTGEGYARRGGALRVKSRDLAPGARRITADALFRFEFDGPLDPTTAPDGVRVVDVERGAASAGVRIDARGADRLEVAPFAGGGFRGGATYRLELTRRLASLDGRALSPESWTFHTAKGPAGEHVTDFRPQDLVDPSLNPEGGPLRPSRSPAVASVFDGADATAPVALGAGPFRLQVLIPAGALGGEDALIEQIILPTSAVGGDAAWLERLELRLGDASPAVALGLSEPFEDNWDGAPIPLTLADADRGGVRVVRAEAGGRAALRLARPFVYRALDARGAPRSLVLEIVAGAPLAEGGARFDLLGRRADPSVGAAAVFARTADATVGDASDVVPAVQLLLVRFAPVVLKPWTTALPGPLYFERPDAVVGKGRLFEDYTVEYRALTPSPLGGDPLETTAWTSRLAALAGRAVVQARVVFHPRPLDPGDALPEIERLVLPYTAER
ncbi:MAG TPA: hypothetical protein VEI02_03620, partial [Planctomycetota bacterium]|nr:hypothetical protein [Planctomycetota bacterium]